MRYPREASCVPWPVRCDVAVAVAAAVAGGGCGGGCALVDHDGPGEGGPLIILVVVAVHGDDDHSHRPNPLISQCLRSCRRTSPPRRMRLRTELDQQRDPNITDSSHPLLHILSTSALGHLTKNVMALQDTPRPPSILLASSSSLGAVRIGHRCP